LYILVLAIIARLEKGQTSPGSVGIAGYGFNRFFPATVKKQQTNKRGG